VEAIGKRARMSMEEQSKEREVGFMVDVDVDTGYISECSSGGPLDMVALLVFP